MKRAVFPIVAAVAIVLSSRAAEITAVQASEAVQEWLDEGSAPGRRAAVVTSSKTLETSSGSRIHVVKFAGGGFAVTSADDRVDPVIAFVGQGGDLVQSDDNPLWCLVRGDIEARERAAGVLPRSASGRRAAVCAGAAGDVVARARGRWSALIGNASARTARMGVALDEDSSAPADVRVDSFVGSVWGQGTSDNGNGLACYNYFTPYNYVCGCVATAGAQIMRYWRWPTASVSPGAFTCKVDGESRDYMMRGGLYSWDDMPLDPADGVTEEQCQAIGKLTYDVGISVGTEWSYDSSFANMFALVPRFKETFGYASAVGAVYIDGVYPYSLSELKKVVIPNCDVRAPVAMSVNGPRGGHVALVDGYGYSGGAFYIHVNFGWAGIDDAWYVPPDIANFTAIDGFVFNVFPAAAGSILSGRVLDVRGAPIASASVTLKRGTSAVATTTTDGKGVYAFIASAGNYTVVAASGNVSSSMGVSLASTSGTRLTSSGAWFSTKASIGNSYGNDIALMGVDGGGSVPSGQDSGASDPMNPGSSSWYNVINAREIWGSVLATKAETLRGAAYYGSDVVGVVELKLGKPKNGSCKVSGSVTLLNGKKHSVKSATIEVGGGFASSVNVEVKDLGDMRIAIGNMGGADVFAGALGSWHVQSANVGGSWPKASATASVEVGDLSMFPGDVQEGLLPAGEVAAASDTKWTFAKAASVKWAKPKKGAELPEIYDAESGKGLVVDTSGDKTNLSGLKLSYKPKTGTFKGSFKIYALEGAGKSCKLKKYTFTATGVVVDGVGYGQAACKKPAATWPISVR